MSESSLLADFGDRLTKFVRVKGRSDGGRKDQILFVSPRVLGPTPRRLVEFGGGLVPQRAARTSAKCDDPQRFLDRQDERHRGLELTGDGW